MKVDLSAAKYYTLGLAIIFTVIDLLFISDIYNFITLPIFILWLVVFRSFKLGFSYYVYATVSLFLCIPILSALNISVLTEKISIYAYLFIIVLCIKEFRMLRHD